MADQNLQNEKESSDVRVSLTGVRLAFTEALFEAKGFKDKSGESGAKRFSCKFLIPKNSPMAEELKAAIVKAATAHFGENAGKVLNRLKAENRICLTDGDLKDYDGYAGNYVLSASNKSRPQLLSAKRQPLSEKDGVLYSGCYVVAKVGIWVQDNGFGERINCNLRGVQFYAPGEAFTGGGAASVDEFEDIPDAKSATLGADSAAAFM